ncbi:ABC transporter permease [Chryseolinea lacunae]|uniref:ABC transporter permease n=1 Tax=Chryseolinea lacunae TaxID=2801331 RepID=A0ABS1KZW7_9BACT|nr:ABC transporter permease [Chryseolinea lacunae]MBL0745006.1 ABC transporter permease [Chryseolinea lacunae]
MLKNYILTTLRNISRRKGFSLLNIVGLSIGLAASLLIMQYVKDEFSYDDFHTHKENIYRVEFDRYREGELVMQCATTFPKVAPALLADYPEVDKACRLYLRYGGGVVRYEDTAIKEDNLFSVEQSFFDVFSYPLLKGDRNTALKEVNTAVVEEETARKYFGEADPMGKRIRFGTEEEYEITGVMRSPENSHLKFSFLLSYPTLVKHFGKDVEEAWGWYDFYTYILLKPNANAAALEAKLPALVKKYGPEGDDKKVKFVLQHLPDIHLNSDLLQEARVNGNGRSVYFLSIIAFFILVIAWVNYINLATARAVERAKEVGVRKAIGAGRTQLMGQFIAEALMVNFAAVVCAIAMMSAAIPVFNALSGKALTTSILVDPYLWLAAAALFVAGSVLSGLYPAVVLSAYQPARVLKGSMKGTREGLMLRKVLVITQFVASVALIAGTLIVYRQLQFMQHRDLGIDIEQMVVIDAPGVVPNARLYSSQYDALKTEILNHPSVQFMTASSEVPGNLIYWTNGSKRIGTDQEVASIGMYRMGIDHDFFDTYKNKVLAGRIFSRAFTADSSSVVLNRKAIELLGFNSPEGAVGGQVSIGGDTLTVVGVVDNYHQEGLKSDFRQTAFSLAPRNHSYYSIKVEAKNVEQTLAFIEEKYTQQFPENPFHYFFLDTFFQRQYKADQQFGQVFGFFALLAILVASLGLFGLASFTASQRTKEIGIRKVLGSSVPNIFLLLSKDFLKLVVIANVIAVPLVVFFMNKWLHTFAFRIDISYWIFVVSAVVTTLIALLTVSLQSVKAALANPVKSLRYE